MYDRKHFAYETRIPCNLAYTIYYIYYLIVLRIGFINFRLFTNVIYTTFTECMMKYMVTYAPLTLNLIVSIDFSFNSIFFSLASLLKPEEIKAMAEKNKADSIESVEKLKNEDMQTHEEAKTHGNNSPRRKSSSYSVHFTGENSDQPNRSSQNTERNKTDKTHRRSSKGPLPPVN